MNTIKERSLKDRLIDAILAFNSTVNGGYIIGESDESLMANFLKKNLSGYMSWGSLGRIKKANLLMSMNKPKENKKYSHGRYLTALRIHIVFFNYEEGTKFFQQIESINTILKNIDFPSLYRPEFILGSFSSKTERIIESIKSYKF